MRISDWSSDVCSSDLAGPAREMDVLADLRATAHGRPGIDHRALAHMRADVDEAGHQHRALADESAAPDDRTGHRAEARLTELTRTPGREFGGHLVPPIGAAEIGRAHV